MFGRQRDQHHDGERDAAAVYNEILGDAEAADHAAQLARLVDRLNDIEQQLQSQFTSMATYAQIGQDQVELARSEARAENDHLERRLVQLLERERADRAADVAQLRHQLEDCVARQRQLADAITAFITQSSNTATA